MGLDGSDNVDPAFKALFSDFEEEDGDAVVLTEDAVDTAALEDWEDYDSTSLAAKRILHDIPDARR